MLRIELGPTPIQQAEAAAAHKAYCDATDLLWERIMQPYTQGTTPEAQAARVVELDATLALNRVYHHVTRRYRATLVAPVVAPTAVGGGGQ